MEDNIKTASPSPEEASFSTSRIISDLKYLLHIFEILHSKSKELKLTFIELRKRNPLMQSKVLKVEDSFLSLFQELLDESNCLIKVLTESNLKGEQGE